MGATLALFGEMDHEFVETNQIHERYLLGKLSSGETLRFEEHFLDCPDCLEHLESSEGLRVGLKGLGSERPGAAEPGRFARARVLRDPRAMALLAACLALAVLPSAFLFEELRRTRGELQSARRSSSEPQRDVAGRAPAPAGERAAGRAAGAAASGSVAPLAASVFNLNLTRGIESEKPDNRIVVRDTREWVILLLDRPDRPGFESFRARISTADRRPIGDALTASVASDDVLAVGLPPGLLAAGDYVLTLEGFGGGPAENLATYRFRAALRK